MSEYVSDPVEPEPVEESEEVEEEPAPAPVEEAEEEPASAAEAVEEEPASAVEEEPASEAAVEESAPVEESASEAEVEEPAPDPVEEPAPVEEVEAPVEEPDPEPVPVEQVASDIREILTPVESANEVEAASTNEVEVSSSSELSDDLKQRIAELDYLRELCGIWLWFVVEQDKVKFLTLWKNKNVLVDSNVNYEDILDQLEKLPEIVKLWVEREVVSGTNYFKNIGSFTLNKPLFNEKNIIEKVEVVEQLSKIMVDYADGKMIFTQIIEIIDNLY